MRKTDIFPSKYLSAADLPDDGMVVTIKDVTIERMQDGAEKPIALFVEDIKDMIINVTKWNTLEKLYGDESDDWAGKKISIKPGEVKFKGEMVACIDISSRKPGAVSPSKAPTKSRAKGSPDAEAAIKAAADPKDRVDDDPSDDPPF